MKENIAEVNENKQLSSTSEFRENLISEKQWKLSDLIFREVFH